MNIKHVLVLEDDKDLIDLYKKSLWEMLLSDSIVPTMACTVHSAISCAQVRVDVEQPFHLAILDYSIRNDPQNGNDAARIIKEISPTTRIVGNTGGNPLVFDRRFVDKVMRKKIRNWMEMMLAIDDHNLGGIP